ncbi:acyl-protein thioesterase 2-like [Hibiscus syriacus]|uniref:Acyl-protein thioesterase 2-like n=1 Tax=Hibiscus syriacus TaxID=106335 RepID=A0A6A2XEH0_HIBSY|nr:E3 ubiquitin-protein ligase At1g63170-like [Hibiscus syriacus]KAE8674093.1 acyl-protein thioesterase 2-like [Hibiscus syriacus]
MGISSPKECTQQTDQYPLLMDRVENHNDQEHIIDIMRHGGSSSSRSHDEQSLGVDLRQSEDRPSISSQTPTNRVSFDLQRLNSRTASFPRNSDGYGRHRRNPLNSGLWISVELVVTLSQIIASVVVLSLSINEKPQAPLFAWIVGYAVGCVATLPILYWRFLNRNRVSEQDVSHSHQDSPLGNPDESTTYTPISVTQASDEGNNGNTESATGNTQIAGTSSTRLNGLVEHWKMALDCFFAAWFVIGSVWIFGGHASPSDAPKLYRLCVVFLTFSCIGYAMPFILCATICCCLPCIITILGAREDFSSTRGATKESINALPIYKFKSKKTGTVDDEEDSAGEGGILVARTEKERVISGEDATCCICLVDYVDEDELRELPCQHVFHVECVDKWLKINATCPLCKSEIGECVGAPPLAGEMNQ